MIEFMGVEVDTDCCCLVGYRKVIRSLVGVLKIESMISEKYKLRVAVPAYFW